MTDDLRIHAADEPAPRHGGDHVLYWMQSTFRTQDNYALEFGIEQANLLGLPLVVYHGLRHDYPWASDRFHTFLLESVVDLYAEFDLLGIQYAFYLERDGDDAASRRSAGQPSPLVELARRAALVVTDYFPTFLAPRQTRALRRKVESPVIAVDSATVVPIRYHEREYPTAPPFRSRLMAALPHFLHQEPARSRRCGGGWTCRSSRRFRATESRSWWPRAISITPSHRSRPCAGGPERGRARLERFLETGLPRYAEERSDPNADATSGLSPYLHFGNLSPVEVGAAGEGGRSRRAVHQVPGRDSHLAGAGVQLHPLQPEASDASRRFRSGPAGSCAPASRTIARPSTAPRSWSGPVRRSRSGTPRRWRMCGTDGCRTRCGCSGGSR